MEHDGKGVHLSIHQKNLVMNDKMIDRMSPCYRPQEREIGYQHWRELLFLHWSVEPNALQSLLPPELELDLYQGQALVGVVPFNMENVRPRWAPRWSAFNFYELNVRAYVIYKGEPGVYFFSLDAASWIAVITARLGWSLPYFPAQFKVNSKDSIHAYRCDRILPKSAFFEAHYQVNESLGPSLEGSLAFFLLERYLLFTKHKTHLYRGQVHHIPYPAFQVNVTHCSTNLVEILGLSRHQKAPLYAHYSPGVEVDIFSLKKVT